MTKRTIDIPIYLAKLTVIIDNDLSYVEKKYKTEPLSNFGAVAFRVENKHGHYVVAFEYTSNSIITHELTHIKNYIYEDRKIDLDVNNDEPEAYLMGWLVESVDKIVAIHKSAIT